ncbi:MAG TPA: hypothetical protein VKV22_02650 [Rhodanobacteraceae bacterium]|nr:hypothetical protein [Rhodanobacteraceae bacterium]
MAKTRWLESRDCTAGVLVVMPSGFGTARSMTPDFPVDRFKVALLAYSRHGILRGVERSTSFLTEGAVMNSSDRTPKRLVRSVG